RSTGGHRALLRYGGWWTRCVSWTRGGRYPPVAGPGGGLLGCGDVQLQGGRAGFLLMVSGSWGGLGENTRAAALRGSAGRGAGYGRCALGSDGQAGSRSGGGCKFDGFARRGRNGCGAVGRTLAGTGRRRLRRRRLMRAERSLLRDALSSLLLISGISAGTPDGKVCGRRRFGGCVLGGVRAGRDLGSFGVFPAGSFGGGVLAGEG